jgi:hypothetical protein
MKQQQQQQQQQQENSHNNHNKTTHRHCVIIIVPNIHYAESFALFLDLSAQGYINFCDAVHLNEWCVEG